LRVTRDDCVAVDARGGGNEMAIVAGDLETLERVSFGN
jgi:hypothetical protein